MGDSVRVFSPVAHERIAEVHLARRPASLAGLRPGILENRKANARALMEALIEGLRARVPLGPLTVVGKPVAGPPSPSVVRTLREHCDFVLVGSCD